YEKTAHVIDYKTGSPDRGRKKLTRPDPNADENASYEKRLGGDYWRQIVFYKLLTTLSNSITWNMEVGEIDFIEAEEGEDGVSKLFVSEEDIQTVVGQIKQAEAGIKGKQFKKG